MVQLLHIIQQKPLLNGESACHHTLFVKSNNTKLLNILAVWKKTAAIFCRAGREYKMQTLDGEKTRRLTCFESSVTQKKSFYFLLSADLVGLSLSYGTTH